MYLPHACMSRLEKCKKFQQPSSCKCPLKTKDRETFYKKNHKSKETFFKLTILARNKFSLKTLARPHRDNASRTNPTTNATVNTQNFIDASK